MRPPNPLIPALLLIPAPTYAQDYRQLHARDDSTSPPTIDYPGGGPTVTLPNYGTIHGTSSTLRAAIAPINKFLGIPFASPPQRFSPAVPPTPWKPSALNATAWKPACIQQFVYPEEAQQFSESLFNTPPAEESEDCLYLNVYAPSTPAPADGRPVLFWIYGGSLQFGHAGQKLYDGSWFAAYDDVIVVTANYRTNVFGFPSSPDLPLTERNLGFLDQRLALQWVQENIGSFGGSPSKVTLFGESAGAFSIDALLTSYNATSTPPFRGAIMQSDLYTYRTLPFASSEPSWHTLAGLLGCNTTSSSSELPCMRAADARTIKRLIESHSLTFDSTPDEHTLVSNPSAKRLSGNVPRIPLYAGTNAQEGRLFTYGSSAPATIFLKSYAGLTNETLLSEILSAYPPSFPDDEITQTSQIYTDFYFLCPLAKLTADSAALGIPTWRYYFNASFANTQPYAGLGVYHTSEIAIVFGTHDAANTTVQQHALHDAMRGAWARFARNPAAGLGWNGVGTGGGCGRWGVDGGGFAGDGC
ncbi:alpha/beta-hydrolase [Teratosphaeria nubilosa]|uniref:Carboxylic ester hydrolase n=1 Tax=Teratosphaeria nubilosa TaxID=161662 RepID=A0A6G1LLR9_9PEZI|nr:alpha/beta-hydrolase [Teratosphaeria nubilosa]